MRQPRVLAGVEAAILAAILVLAGILRFADLSQRGLIYWDEGKFALEGVRLRAALESALLTHGPVIAGKTIGTAKPTHALLIGLAMAVWGVHDYSALLLNATASLLNVLLTYLIGRRLFGPVVALIGALLFAFSEYEVIYARSALSETDGTAIFLAGFLMYLSSVDIQSGRAGESSVIPLGGAALLMGLSFTTNYRLIVYIAAILALDALYNLRVGRPGAAVARASVWGAGLLLAPALWQLTDVLTRANGLTLFRNELTGARMWYLQQALYQLHEGKQSVLHVSPVPYLQWFLTRQGYPVSFLVLAGLALALWRRSFPWLALAFPVLIPYLIFVFAPFFVPRNLEAALPFTSLLAAGALCVTAAAVRPRPAGRVLLMVVSLMLAIIGSSMTWRLTSIRSGFAAAAGYLGGHAGGRALNGSEIMVFYLQGAGKTCLVPPLPRHVTGLGPMVRAGYHYAVLDRRHGGRVRAYLRLHESLVLRVLAAGDPAIGENLIASENSYAPANTAGQESVEVYRLNPALGRLDPGGRAEDCNRNLVT